MKPLKNDLKSSRQLGLEESLTTDEIITLNQMRIISETLLRDVNFIYNNPAAKESMFEEIKEFSEYLQIHAAHELNRLKNKFEL